MLIRPCFQAHHRVELIQVQEAADCLGADCVPRYVEVKQTENLDVEYFLTKQKARYLNLDTRKLHIHPVALLLYTSFKILSFVSHPTNYDQRNGKFAKGSNFPFQYPYFVRKFIDI